MTNFKHFLFLSALLMAFTGQAQSEEAKAAKEMAGAAVEEAAEAVEEAACDMPGAPIIPDGNVASEDELIAAQSAMKMFQGSLISYRECIQGLEKLIDPESETAVAEGEELLANFNKSVDAEEQVAAEFNEAVKAFKARQN